jgi:hypothetical protein
MKPRLCSDHKKPLISPDWCAECPQTQASDWICDEGGLHWTGNPCDCAPEEDDE